MSNSVKKIARLLTEDPDILNEKMSNVFDDYQDRFRENTVLDEEIYGDIVGILKDVAHKSGLVLDHSKLKVKFNPAGISIQNIYLDCPDAHTKRELIARVAEVTGDDNIKHTFNKNLRVNLYNAINKEFADRIREELNLEITHQSMDPEGSQDASGILPMATFTQPAVTATKPEEEMDMGEPSPEPEGGPEVPPEEGEEVMGGMGGGGGMPMGGGGMPMGGLGDLGEPPSPEEAPEDEEMEAGPFGVEPSEEGEEEEEAEEAPPPEPDEEEEMLSFESIQRIAGLLTEDPDVFAEETRCRGERCRGNCRGTTPLPCWVCEKPTVEHPYVDGEQPYGYCGCEDTGRGQPLPSAVKRPQADGRWGHKEPWRQ